jgi:hypothetical protein
VSADAGDPFDRNAPVGKGVHIERYIDGGWAGIFGNYGRKNVTFLLPFCCSSLASDDFLSQLRFLLSQLALLGIPPEEE